MWLAGLLSSSFIDYTHSHVMNFLKDLRFVGYVHVLHDGFIVVGALVTSWLSKVIEAVVLARIKFVYTARLARKVQIL